MYTFLVSCLNVSKTSLLFTNGSCNILTCLRSKVCTLHLAHYIYIYIRPPLCLSIHTYTHTLYNELPVSIFFLNKSILILLLPQKQIQPANLKVEKLINANKIVNRPMSSNKNAGKKQKWKKKKSKSLSSNETEIKTEENTHQ